MFQNNNKEILVSSMKLLCNEGKRRTDYCACSRFMEYIYCIANTAIKPLHPSHPATFSIHTHSTWLGRFLVPFVIICHSSFHRRVREFIMEKAKKTRNIKIVQYVAHKKHLHRHGFQKIRTRPRY